MPNNVHNNLAEELNDYFKALALSSTLIPYDGNNHNYISMGVEEMKTIGHNVKFGNDFGLVYEPIDAKLHGKGLYDATIDSGIALWFLKFSRKDDFASRQIVLQEAFKIAMSFLAKVKYDQEEYTKGNNANPVVSRFDLASVELNIVGPIGDYHFGYVLEFMIGNDGRIEFDEDEWA